MDLVVMAAGMGSRFGGMKQIEPVGPNGEFIIDYSIYDAIRAGFDRVIFIIKEENYQIFKDTVGKRIENHIKVDYAFQRLEDIPSGYNTQGRVKPWGTAHAILSCRDFVDGDFLIVNADDFYGYDSFLQASKFFRENHSGEYALIGYQADHTLTDNGAVKRGVCELDGNYLSKLTECSLEKNGDMIKASPLDSDLSYDISSDNLVSMNMFCFKKDLFSHLEEQMKVFFEKNKDDLSKVEYLIPDVVYHMIENHEVSVRVIPTTSTWYGITYKEDLEEFKNNINRLINEGVYPSNLWE